jgi:hypothetical protein
MDNYMGSQRRLPLKGLRNLAEPKQLCTNSL